MNKEHASTSSERMHFIMFGYDTFSAAKNMAIDETIKSLCEEMGGFFIRFFGFEKPSVILSLSDSLKCVRLEHADGVEITRRQSGGKPIYVDENVLAYSIVGATWPKEAKDFTSLAAVHNYFGLRIARAIEKYSGSKSAVEIGEVYSIKVAGKPIAGHAQYPTLGKAFFYHGVVAMKKWDADRINALLRMRPGDYEELKRLPSIASIMDAPQIVDAELQKKKLANFILDEVTGGNYEEINEDERKDVLSKANVLLEKKYRSKKWVEEANGGKLREDSTFCLLYTG
ncbi:MAG: hypothetical protein QXK65_00290 [Candidatus Micrarchaeaceae archaeon]